MKWFKHISDSLDDPFIFELMDEFGDFGYLFFFGVLEIYAREYKPENFKRNQGELTIKLSFIRQKLKQKRTTKIIKALEYIQRSGKWNVLMTDTEVTVFIPKFNQLADEWTKKKLRSESGVTPENLRHEVEVDKEEDTDKDKLPKKSIKRKFKKPTVQQIADYCQERNNGIDARAFYDHYETRNWKPKGYTQQMTDWKAAVRTWEKNNKAPADNQAGIKKWLNQDNETTDHQPPEAEDHEFDIEPF